MWHKSSKHAILLGLSWSTVPTVPLTADTDRRRLIGHASTLLRRALIFRRIYPPTVGCRVCCWDSTSCKRCYAGEHRRRTRRNGGTCTPGEVHNWPVMIPYAKARKSGTLFHISSEAFLSTGPLTQFQPKSKRSLSMIFSLDKCRMVRDAVNGSVSSWPWHRSTCPSGGARCISTHATSDIILSMHLIYLLSLIP